MLYRAVIGTEPPNHPELMAFKRGLMLPCRNGFNFFKVTIFLFVDFCNAKLNISLRDLGLVAPKNSLALFGHPTLRHMLIWSTISVLKLPLSLSKVGSMQL
jgi:hypothetical protein